MTIEKLKKMINKYIGYDIPETNTLEEVLELIEPEFQAMRKVCEAAADFNNLLLSQQRKTLSPEQLRRYSDMFDEKQMAMQSALDALDAVRNEIELDTKER